MVRFLLLVFVGFVVASKASAVRLIVEDPCHETPWYDERRDFSANDSVGKITISAFEERLIPFVGSEQGIVSINGTVYGSQSLQVINATEMKSYGWCFSINDIVPDAYPHQIADLSIGDIITWFYGYAHFRGGHWVSMCTPIGALPPEYVCNAGD